MSYFLALLSERQLPKHDGRPLWKYSINENEFQKLTNTLRLATRFNVDPRDASLFYAHWWQLHYRGGKPGKQEVYDSLGITENAAFTKDEFYHLARKGAQILGITWVKKQYTLYFKTLLLQGGLPRRHISENHGRYKSFLEAVLDEQPETIEDFIFKKHIINLLPKSSQNDAVYENCLEIVKSILRKDDKYKDLLESEESLKEIYNSLKTKTQTKKTRQQKPKNYWLLTFKNDTYKINLRLGLADTYKKVTLWNLFGFEPVDRSYQLFVNENLICTFRKMIDGAYKTDWYNQENIEFDELEIPYTYVIADGNKVELPNFIQTIPNLAEPSLWVQFSDNEWRYVKGNAAANKEAALLLPADWHGNQTFYEVNLNGNNLSLISFEGEVEVTNGDQHLTFLSNVNSFDWAIASNKPSWMAKANMPVVQGLPKVFVYDEEGKTLKWNQFKTWVKKHNSSEVWKEIRHSGDLPSGCFDLRIKYGELTALDIFYNIGNLNARYSNQTIDSVEIEFEYLNTLECKLLDTELVKIQTEGNLHHLKLNTAYGKIPNRLKGKVGLPSKKGLFFDIASPFRGMAITDRNDHIITEEQPLSLANLYGMRVISSPGTESTITFKNNLKPDVIISKTIMNSTQPLVSFKEEIVRLYYLADAMDYRNTVSIELSEGRKRKTYKISGFSYTLNVAERLQRKVWLFDSTDVLELFAIPLNCSANDINPIPLMENEFVYEIPQTGDLQEFIIISSKIEGKQLMPRYLSTDDAIVGIDKYERVNTYHDDLSKAEFKDEIWKQLLAYYKICTQFDLPFSTFDQLRAISKSSQVAARAFFLIGINQLDINDFIQKEIPEMEKDLGFCFHWISAIDWGNAFAEINLPDKFKYQSHIAELLSSYLAENGLQELFKYINKSPIDSVTIHRTDIIELRSRLGARVLKELPYNIPTIKDNYGIPVIDNSQVRLLLQSPIAVAESITGQHEDFTVWGGDEHLEEVRRNIQYSQYLDTDFYNKAILHVLTRS